MKDKRQKISDVFEHFCAVFRDSKGMETRILVFAIGGIALTMAAAMLMSSFGGISDIMDKQINRSDTISATNLPVGECARFCITGGDYSGGICVNSTLSVPDNYHDETYGGCDTDQTCYCL